MRYDYEIIYKPGKTNSTGDALSRKEGSPTINAISIPQSSIWTQIQDVATCHTYMQKIGSLATEPYGWRNGSIYFHNRFVVPPNSFVIPPTNKGVSRLTSRWPLRETKNL